MKKLLATLVLFASLSITACGGGNKTSSSGKHTHSWGEWQEVTAPSCEAKGSQKRTCKTCNEVETKELDALGHDYTGTPVAQAEVADCANSSTVKCSRCQKNALRWAAKDYNADESNDLEATRSDGSFRLKTARYWTGSGNDGSVDPNVEGSRAVYYISSYAAATNVGFAFNIQQKSDWDGPLFETQSGDNLRGQNKIVDEQGNVTYKRADHRYELRINDQVIELGTDKTNVSQGTKGWYDWPLVNGFNLNTGKNKVEIICLGGYRAYLYDFQFTNMPALAA